MTARIAHERASGGWGLRPQTSIDGVQFLKWGLGPLALAAGGAATS